MREGLRTRVGGRSLDGAKMRHTAPVNRSRTAEGLCGQRQFFPRSSCLLHDSTPILSVFSASIELSTIRRHNISLPHGVSPTQNAETRNAAFANYPVTLPSSSNGERGKPIFNPALSC